MGNRCHERPPALGDYIANLAAGNPIQQGALVARRDAIVGRDRPSDALPEPVQASEVRSANFLEERAMTLLKWALIFFLVSVVAGILGFTGISAASADIARFLFYVFVVIFLVLLILGLTIFRV
jgi:uncharacterized membrane protein YtjA (UPF0391 family)